MKGKRFQHDGTPYHKSSVTQQSLVDEGVSVLKDRSVESLNLDIEQMWTEIKNLSEDSAQS